MVNKETLEKIRILEQKYKETWGINVDYTIIPSGMTQENLADVLERIIDTGESITVGFSNIKTKSGGIHNKEKYYNLWGGKDAETAKYSKQ